jgi:hypothetical protein
MCTRKVDSIIEELEGLLLDELAKVKVYLDCRYEQLTSELEIERQNREYEVLIDKWFSLVPSVSIAQFEKSSVKKQKMLLEEAFRILPDEFKWRSDTLRCDNQNIPCSSEE